jgi:hypothetical protein
MRRVVWDQFSPKEMLKNVSWEAEIGTQETLMAGKELVCLVAEIRLD